MDFDRASPHSARDPDTTYVFELTVTVHEDDEAEANIALGRLFEAADELGMSVVWKTPA